MAIRKNTKAQAIFPEVSAGSDIAFRLEKISEQTSLSPLSLLNKWLLQEETLIGLIRNNKEQITDKAPISMVPAAVQEEGTDKPDAGSPEFRKILVKRVRKLNKEGCTLVKMAQTFNDEKVPTLSGTGKWYASSVSKLLKSKI